jgi:hypothetical protein
MEQVQEQVLEEEPKEGDLRSARTQEVQEATEQTPSIPLLESISNKRIVREAKNKNQELLQIHQQRATRSNTTRNSQRCCCPMQTRCSCAACGEQCNLRCARCLCVAYCSRACQVRDFKVHTRECRRVLERRVLDGKLRNCEARARLNVLLKRVGVRGVRARAEDGDVELQWQWGLRCAVDFSDDAMEILEHNYPGDDPAEWGEALKWLLKAAKAGLPDAQYAAALMIQTTHDKMHGWTGKTTVADEASALLRQAAKQGHPKALEWMARAQRAQKYV